jgi:hypothetical protein
MARIRSIKPEFWTSEQVMGLNPVTRLLFIGMWNFADDFGRMPFAPGTIKAQVMPMDNVSIQDVRGMIMELDSAGLILIYSAEGREYIEVTGWSHQKIDKPHKPKCPAPFSEQTVNVDEPSPNIPRSVDEPSPLDRIGEEKDKKESPRAPRCEEQKFEEFWKAYPKRKGDNPKNPARKQFFAAVKQGADPDAIIAGVKRACERNREKIGTEFIPQAIKWLRDRRWEDYTDAPDVPSGFVLTLRTPEQARLWLEAKAAAGENTAFMKAQLERGGSITVPSEYPPGHERAA